MQHHRARSWRIAGEEDAVGFVQQADRARGVSRCGDHAQRPPAQIEGVAVVDRDQRGGRLLHQRRVFRVDVSLCKILVAGCVIHVVVRVHHGDGQLGERSDVRGQVALAEAGVDEQRALRPGDEVHHPAALVFDMPDAVGDGLGGKCCRHGFLLLLYVDS